MAIQLGATLRNAMMDSFETVWGASATLEIWSGTKPANCAAADAGDGAVLATIALPTDMFNSASSGQITLKGAWADASADSSGTASHYRVKTSGASVQEQGGITVTGGGGDLTLDSVSITAGQSVTITSWTRTAGNA